MSKKTVLIELSERTETLLSWYAVAWAMWLALFDFEDSISTGRYIIGLWIAFWGLLLLLTQWKRLRVRLDYSAAKLMLRMTPDLWASWIVRIWPLSIIARAWLHFWFVVWWLLMAYTVSRRLDDLDDIRLLAYLLVALLHFDRFLRLIQGRRA